MRAIHTRGILPLPLYRFTKKKWADFFFRTGQLKLGTIFDYAKNEKYGDAIHDRHEGYCAFVLPEDQPIAGRPVARMTLARNNLLLCFSKEYSEALYKEFDADCCIVINDAKFFSCIDDELKSEFTEPLVRQVTYIDKSKWDYMPRYEDFAGVIKDTRFKDQKEVRALWEPKKAHRQKVNIPPFTPEETSGDGFLINASEKAWYDNYVKQECKWLKPRTIFVPAMSRS
jgi:hypothetical protein